MKTQQLKFEDFRANQLSRFQKTNVIGGDIIPPVELDENGNPLNPKGNGSN